ncbi:MAG: T9SS type A sorting domain-containing protein [Flavobacteriales bacterium]|nr:T9SS type A sorting domain-containing protein [Flavobacteriales bacterium]
MIPHSLRRMGLALLLAAPPALCLAQQSGLLSGSPTPGGTRVLAFGLTAAPSPGCAGPYGMQITDPATPWGQNYGGVNTYFTLPAGNGPQTFQAAISFTNVFGNVFLNNQPVVQVFIDGQLCTTCNVQFESYNGSTYNSNAAITVTHQAGHAWSTDGIHEFGLRFRFPPQTSPTLDVRFKAVMVGTSFSEVLGTYDAPALPLFILRDPPGDGSFSSLTTGSTTCYGNSRSMTTGSEEGGYFKTKLGVAGEAGFIVTTAFEFSVEVGVSINATQTATSDFEYTTCMEATEEFTTADDGTPDDVFIGNAVRYKYGMATVIERPSCGTVTKEAFFISAPDTTLMDYSYTESYISGTVIPQLNAQIALFTPGTPAYKKAVNQRDVWVRTLQLNNEIKATAPLSVIRSFNGGGIGVQHTLTSTTSTSAAIDYEVTLEGGLSLDFALEVGGSGISAGGSVKMRSEYGNGQTNSNTTTNTMSYTLRDDDVFDNFAVQVKRDAYFGTYAFVLDSANSRTSCRYEGGYQLDQPGLSVGTPGNTTMTVTQAPIGSAVNFPLFVCNNSDITRTYYLRFSAATNAQGAILQAFGNTMNSNDNGIQLEIGPGACITSNLTLTQPNASVVDFSNINLYLYSLCDEEYPPYIRSYISVSAFFGAGNIGNVCIPASSQGTAEGDFIDGVRIGNINNTGTGAQGGPAYTNYSAQFSTPLSRNGQYMVTVTSGAYFENAFSVWIDLDRNGTFASNERIGSFTTSESFQTVSIPFTVPADASLGTTLMRVRASYLPGQDPASMDACFAYDYGETEDYAIVINDNTPTDCAGAANGPALPGTACNDNNPLTGNDNWNANCQCAGIPVDCTGVPGGNNGPGSPCNDGNPNTANDVYTANCQCAGQLIDCLGLPGGSATPGTACNDGLASTGNDTWNADCQCVGLLIDCTGTPGGNALPGTPCNDGNPLSTNDTYDSNCQCAGVLPLDCNGVAGGPAQPGTPCNDNNPTTGNDTYGANCLCAGLPFDCAGTPGGSILPGTPCNDGNPQTINDVFTANCDCAGQLVNDCAGVPGGNAQPGTPCNDGNANTGNDTWNAFCQCVGQLIDCTGVPGGIDLPGAPCNDGNPNTGNDVYGANCVCAGQPLDCLGVPGGTATVGTPCNDGNPNTNNDVYTANCVCAGALATDCLGVPGGSAQPGTACNDGNPATGNDVYGTDCVCVGLLIDCAGTPGGSALPGTACNDGDPCTTNDIWDTNCNCAGTPGAVGTITSPATVDAGSSVTLFINPVPGATSYAWTIPADWTSTNTSTFVLVAQAGSSLGEREICIDVTANGCLLNGCTSVTVTGTTGIEENSAAPWFTVRPNPSNGVFTLTSTDAAQEQTTLRVHDATGREVLRSVLAGAARVGTLDLTAVGAGTYYLIAARNGVQQVTPLVVTH